MADFEERPTFRVRDTGALLVCKCGCFDCADATKPSEHCVGDCSIGRHMDKARRRAETKTRKAADDMREKGVIWE